MRRLSLLLLVAAAAADAFAGSLAWTPIGPPVAYMQAITFDPANATTMYAGTRGGGVFKTTDGGTSWVSINNGILGPTNSSSPDGRWIYSVAVDPTSSQVVYAGGIGVVYRSGNAGQSWTASALSRLTDQVQTIAIDPNNSTILYAGTNHALYKSTNSGAGWNDISSSIPITTVSKIEIVGSTIYALANYLYKSTDGAATFGRIDGTGSFDPPAHDFDVDPLSGSRHHADGSAGEVGGFRRLARNR